MLGVAAGMALTRRIGPTRESPVGQHPPRALCRTRSGRKWRGSGVARPLRYCELSSPPSLVSDAVRRPPFPLRFSPAGTLLVCSPACWRFALNWPHPCCLVARPQMRPSRPRHARPAPVPDTVRQEMVRCWLAVDGTRAQRRGCGRIGWPKGPVPVPLAPASPNGPGPSLGLAPVRP